jgi:uncharacterized protein with FMN-binding domain
MAILKKIKSFAPMLSVVLAAACIGISLHGYEAPVYAAQEATEVVADDATDTQSEEEEDTTTAIGSFDLEDGFYEGTGTGYAGDITVMVEIKDHQIAGIEIVDVEADDAAFFNRAKGVIDKIIQNQSLDVDVVSGATYSSRGIISAVKNALTGEKDTTTAVASSSSTAAGSKTVSQVTEASAYKDGVYEGTGTGFAGALTVQVTISGGNITDIVITKTSDGSSYIQAASGVISAIISAQSTNVDTVSGATYSSVGIIEAVRNALAKAAVSTDQTTNQTTTGSQNQTTQQEQQAVEGTVPYLDGIYYGTSEGYLGDITVAVVIQDYTIKAILITDTVDDEAFLNRAKEVAANVVLKQNTDVDLVSGATYSSRGILEAIKEALAEAERQTNAAQNGTDAGNQTTGSTQNPSQNTTNTQKPSQNESGTQNPGQNTGNGNADSGENNGDGNTSNDTESVFKSGEYLVTVLCEPDEDEDFDEYSLSLKMTIKNDRITAITDVTGNGDKTNDSYIKRAAEGTSKITGMIAQILNKENAAELLSENTVSDLLNANPPEFDTVSRATCTSKSILEAVKQGLEYAVSALVNDNTGE